MNDVEISNLRLLTRALAALETPEEAEDFLHELCTPKEIRALAQRLAIAELLVQKIPYSKIGEALDSPGDEGSRPSAATISRVNDTVQNGDGSLGKIIMRVSDVQGN